MAYRITRPAYRASKPTCRLRTKLTSRIESSRLFIVIGQRPVGTRVELRGRAVRRVVSIVDR